ncbi:hypothetical protein ASF61_08600 [Duganella sp. Leaf126]|uniref:YciI family protein n=1 Tax=Duganella sp. Leaf126 TaxID=1736266 RepID=UPI0006F6719F|nr:YciI family protein [Duganella sp. Leaf126]KQQ36232.1 hypothetical protein ASF61_08600 [Duganella sp. Leaf126]
MLYVVKIIYTVPMDQLAPHIPAHKAWLSTEAGNGHIIVAGPFEDRSGGMLIAHCDSRAALDAMLARDAYQVHQVATCEVTAFDAALRAASFPAAWAAADARAA